MGTQHSINSKSQFNSIRLAIEHFVLLSVCPPMFLYFFEKADDVLFLIPIFIIYAACFCAPAILIHLDYYRTNSQSQIGIDLSHKLITFKENSTESKVSFNEIQSVKSIQHRDYSFSPNQRGWFEVPWMDYNLLVVTTTDGNEFIITSLMMDITEFPIPPTERKYVHFPFVRKLNRELKIEKENRIEIFKMALAEKSIIELQEIKDDQDRDPDSRIAAQNLIDERNS